MNKRLLPIILFTIILLFGCSKHKVIKSIEVSGVERPEIVLNGTWKFSMNPPEKFWKNTIDFKNWKDIEVPGECQMQGFAIKHDQPYVYKTEFDIPLDYEGKQINLIFYGVYSYAKVWVNGKYIRDHHGGFTKWSCNISDIVTAGEKASLTIEITDRTDEISYASGYAKHQIGGILRDVELTALPKQNFKELYFETDLDESNRDAELKVHYKLNHSTPAKIKVELFDAYKILVEAVEHETDQFEDEFLIPVMNPEKWDAEHPNLYTVVTTLFEDGKEILKRSDKIGFRKVEIIKNKMLVNGKPVKLRGACRHDVHPTLGRMTTPEYDLMDVLLAKESNMNFIRTSHYPPSERFLELCDEYGLYVEDETAICFVHKGRSKRYKATSLSADDPDYTERYLSQLKEMVHNHRNHPCVILWSIGNENNFGQNFKLSYDWVKENDKTRPVIFSYPQNVPEGTNAYDIYSNHYPNWDGTSSRYKGADINNFEYGDIPALFDEWAHVACYNKYELKNDPNVRNFWSQSLDSMWTYLFEAEGGLGGAIWCMLDETFMLPEDLEGYNEWWGLINRKLSHASYEGPVIGYGEWGIVDTWRRKKPEFWGTKKAYSPTKIMIKQIHEFVPNKKLNVPVHNRFDHTDFSELKIRWKYGENSCELENITLEPHKKGELIIPANNWNTNEKLKIQFLQNDTFLIDEYNIQIGEKMVQLPGCKNGNLKIREVDNQISISGKNYSVWINKNTGLLEKLKVNNELSIKSGPYVNLKFPGKKQQTNIDMDDHVQDWKLTDFNFTSKDGIANIKTSGTSGTISVIFNLKMDENGLFDVSYELQNVPTDKNIQEAGLKFITGDSFEKLAWNKRSYFTAYPENHPGNTVGEASLTIKPEMNYRVKPNHTWELDTKNYYYFGLDTELPYPNIARGSKENFYSYSLQSSNATMTVLSDGKQAARFDNIEGNNTLIVNDHWDYNSLLWGNYSKRIKSDGELQGRVVIKFEQ